MFDVISNISDMRNKCIQNDIKRFNISQSTLSTWKKQRAKINEMVDVGKVLNQKCNHESFLPQVERALHL